MVHECVSTCVGVLVYHAPVEGRGWRSVSSSYSLFYVFVTGSLTEPEATVLTRLCPHFSHCWGYRSIPLVCVLLHMCRALACCLHREHFTTLSPQPLTYFSCYDPICFNMQ